MRIRLLALLMFLTLATLTHAQDTPTENIYTVTRPMTVEELSRELNVCIADIMSGNMIRYDRRLVVGQQLRIWTSDTPCYTSDGKQIRYFLDDFGLNPVWDTNGWIIHYVQATDTLLSVSRRYNVCTDAIAAVNMLGRYYLNFYPLQSQEKIYIPNDAAPCYDETTGDKLRYISSDGKLLAKPAPVSGEIYAEEQQSGSLKIMAYTRGICLQTLQRLNPDLPGTDFFEYGETVILPTEYEPCYIKHVVPQNTILRLDEIALQYNVCQEMLLEEFYVYAYEIDKPLIHDVTVYIPLDAPPCYNEQDQRLYFYTNQRNELAEPVYSDLSVAVVQPNDTWDTLAKRHNVCPEDLIKFNPFLTRLDRYSVNYVTFRDIFIPDVPPCFDAETGQKFIYFDKAGKRLNPPDKVTVEFKIVTTSMPADELNRVAQEHYVCPDELEQLNPIFKHPFERGAIISYPTYIPVEASSSCYQEYYVGYETVLDVTRQYNICPEEILGGNLRNGLQPGKTLFIPLHHLPCFNEAGQRLSYYDEKGTSRTTPIYSDLPVHIVQPGDSRYTISRQYNICVNELERINRFLNGTHLQVGMAVFIPTDALPCYDEETGKQWLYIGQDGTLLPEPVLSDDIYYRVEAGDTSEKIARMYNVCQDSLWEANKNRTESDLGWDIGDRVIIPVDSPACYALQSLEPTQRRSTDIYCYEQTLESIAGLPAEPTHYAFQSGGGLYCYHRDNITDIMYANKPVVILPTSMRINVEIAAPCFGVTAEDIRNVHERFYPGLDLPPTRRVIPEPTRDCYLTDPNFDTTGMVQVAWGDTLSALAKQHLTLPAWIAAANNLPDMNLIYPGQWLIIPPFNLIELGKIIGGVVMIVVLYAGAVVLFRRRRGMGKAKRKNTEKQPAA